MSTVNTLSIIALVPSLLLVVFVLAGITIALAREASRAFAPRIRSVAVRIGASAKVWFRSLLPPAPARIELPRARLSRV